MSKSTQFFLENKATFAFLIIVLFIYVFSKYILPRFLSLFSARLFIRKVESSLPAILLFFLVFVGFKLPFITMSKLLGLNFFAPIIVGVSACLLYNIRREHLFHPIKKYRPVSFKRWLTIFFSAFILCLAIDLFIVYQRDNIKDVLFELADLIQLTPAVLAYAFDKDLGEGGFKSLVHCSDRSEENLSPSESIDRSEENLSPSESIDPTDPGSSSDRGTGTSSRPLSSSGNEASGSNIEPSGSSNIGGVYNTGQYCEKLNKCTTELSGHLNKINSLYDEVNSTNSATERIALLRSAVEEDEKCSDIVTIGNSIKDRYKDHTDGQAAHATDPSRKDEITQARDNDINQFEIQVSVYERFIRGAPDMKL